jgi:hypothetical protein
VLVRRERGKLRLRTPNAAGGLGAIVALGVLLVAAGCSGRSGGATLPPEGVISEAPAVSVQRDPDVPALPFPDNPDPNACGIPTPFGGYAAWVNGVYQDQVVEPTVLLYDSHERLHVTGTVPSGTEVQVKLYQANPVLDFYYVQVDIPSGPQKGWVPAPFLQFTPPSS